MEINVLTIWRMLVALIAKDLLIGDHSLSVDQAIQMAQEIVQKSQSIQ